MNPLFGGSGITEDVFQAICHVIEKSDTVLEFGSGDASTLALASKFNVVSVEHDGDYVGRHPVRYIHAPLVNGWYDVDIVRREMPSDYRLVLVDGPPGDKDNRSGILNHLDLFNSEATYVVHDIHRSFERDLAIKLAAWCGRPLRWGDEFAII